MELAVTVLMGISVYMIGHGLRSMQGMQPFGSLLMITGGVLVLVGTLT